MRRCPGTMADEFYLRYLSVSKESNPNNHVPLSLPGALPHGSEFHTCLHMTQKQKDKVALQDRGNSQDSKKIEQRNYNLPAMNFESSEDNIGGGIDMGDMEPS